jgi:hypothetical protein
MNYQIIRGLALDSAAQDGLPSEVSQVVTMEGNNAIQIQVLMYALTATNVSVTLQTSNDLANWTNQPSPQTVTAVGRKLLTSDTAVAASYARVLFELTGTGKAILDADLNVSPL